MQVQGGLERLEDTGLIEKTKSGNRSYYRVYQKHPAFQDIKSALFKTVLFGDLLKDNLLQVKNRIRFCFIYGFTAIGKETSDSDIDLFIVGNLGILDLANI